MVFIINNIYIHFFFISKLLCKKVLSKNIDVTNREISFIIS